MIWLVIRLGFEDIYVFSPVYICNGNKVSIIISAFTCIRNSISVENTLTPSFGIHHLANCNVIVPRLIIL